MPTWPTEQEAALIFALSHARRCPKCGYFYFFGRRCSTSECDMQPELKPVAAADEWDDTTRVVIEVDAADLRLAAEAIRRVASST